MNVRLRLALRSREVRVFCCGGSKRQGSSSAERQSRDTLRDATLEQSEQEAGSEFSRDATRCYSRQTPTGLQCELNFMNYSATPAGRQQEASVWEGDGSCDVPSRLEQPLSEHVPTAAVSAAAAVRCRRDVELLSALS